ncbi:hypothetical protein SprV_0401711500 [Sparganum proliferum]
MLGIRTKIKPDLECSAAELVYGTTLRIPGDFFGYSQSSADLDPSDYVQRLRQAMTHLRAIPPRPPTNADMVNLVATIESILKQTRKPDVTTHLIRQQVTTLVMAYKPRAIITKAEQSAIKTLRNDASIVILPADEEGSTVVLDKTDYVQKANALLEDRRAYLQCGDESIKTLVTKLEKTLADMQSNKAISKSVWLTIKPTDAVPARFYGLTKVHKAGLPLRPIVSLRGTPTYNLAKFLFRILSSLTSSAATTVCSAAQFLERHKGIGLSEEKVMVSFDVAALFTSIPQCLAVKTVSELLESKYDETIRHLVMRPKIHLPPGETTNVIYGIQCGTCEMSYIGETGKRLQTRVGEDKKAMYSVVEYINDKTVAVVAAAWFYDVVSVIWPKNHKERAVLLNNNRRPPDGTKVVENRAEEASNSRGSSSLQCPLMGGNADRPHCVTIHDASTGSVNELHGDININIAAPSFSPVHLDEAKGPANDAQTAENRGLLNRDHCIIIQGLPESSASTPRERVAADLEQFQKLINEMLQPTEDVTVLKAFRLGSRTTAAPQTRPRPLKIVLVYRPPRNDPDADVQLLEELTLFSTRPTTLIVGDFNAPHINWSSASADCSEAAFDQQLLRTSDNLLLTQHVMFPTRVREGQQMNCLDLVFTKSSDNIDVVNCLPPLGQSDHVVLMWEYTLFSLPAQPLDSRPNIWRGDFEQMRKDLSPIDWASILSGDVEEDWCQFKELAHNLISNHCPIMRRRLTNRPRWLTPSLKKEVNKKRKLWKRCLADRTPESLSSYKLQRNRVKILIARDRKAFEKDLLNRAMVNPKVLYS